MTFGNLFAGRYAVPQLQAAEDAYHKAEERYGGAISHFISKVLPEFCSLSHVWQTLADVASTMDVLQAFAVTTRGGGTWCVEWWFASNCPVNA